MVLKKNIFNPVRNAPKSVEDLIGRSSKAVCGVTERELTVPRQRVGTVIKRLKGAGFHVIGTSYGKTPTKKVWFIRGGGL